MKKIPRAPKDLIIIILSTIVIALIMSIIITDRFYTIEKTNNYNISQVDNTTILNKIVSNDFIDYADISLTYYNKEAEYKVFISTTEEINFSQTEIPIAELNNVIDKILELVNNSYSGGNE